MNKIKNVLDDLLVLAGCGCILYGISLLNAIATWITAGVMLIVLGFLYGKFAS